MSRETVQRIERAAVRAWPASHTAQINGWLWRCTGGGSTRANSVSTLAFNGRNLETAIRDVEWRYRARRAQAMFQICDVSMPADLDDRLSWRGYQTREPSITLAKEIAPRDLPEEIEITDAPTSTWLEVYLGNVTEDRRKLAPMILARIPPPRAFLLVRRKGAPASTALAVLNDGIVVAECVGTRAGFRRAGCAAQAMQALEAWGGKRGARIAALQAVADNARAGALYAKLDYRQVGRYHYRVLGT